MKYLILPILLLSLTHFSFGQNYFNKLIDLSNPNGEYYTSIIYNNIDNTLWTVGISNYSNKPKLYHFDTNCISLDTFDVATSTTGTNFVAGLESSLFIDNLNNLIIVGQISHGDTVNNGIIHKIKQNGDTLWVKEFGTLNYYDGLISGLQDTDSTYIFSGYTGSIIGSSTYDLWLLKTDTAGNILWQNNFFGGGSRINAKYRKNCRWWLYYFWLYQ